MQKLVFNRNGSALLMSMVVLGILCGTMTGCQHYLKRQRMINMKLTNQLIAESMVKLSTEQDSQFNYGWTTKISQSKWLVTMKNGEKIKVII
ncbi:MAG TPA: hypothetical protein H9792_06820 [Candidatus Limosilactobacillus excrementigallinarum]|nr:hypothetical protein [Candidatus Limosilactobacillus excrementigallinarum]